MSVRAARALVAELGRALQVPVDVALWDGSRVPLGSAPASAPEAGEGAQRLAIRVRGPEVLASLLRRPRLESLAAWWAEGGLDLDGGDLVDLLDRLRERPRGGPRVRALPLALRALPLLVAPGRVPPLPHAFAPAAETSDQEAVEFHYDLGNEFYGLFLDPEMQYSCAYFTDWKHDLEQAQRDKLEMICRKLRLRPGERLLDVGCGWGGLACHAARHHGVEVLGITLSRAQLEGARERVRAHGLEDRVHLALQDVHDLDPGREGRFDKIASVGMVEHVPLVRHPAYFAKLASLLRDKGLLLNHGITRGAKGSERRFRRSRPEKRLVLRHVFPGTELDHVGRTVQHLEARGFEVRDVEDWREHYALTTRHWSRRLAARAEAAERLVGAPRHRIWLAWLAGVSSAFQDGSLRLYQVLASRHASKGASELPPTRADLYRS